MLKLTLRLACLAILAAPALAFADKPVPATTAAGTVNAYRAKTVLGTKVNIQDNVAIGTVDDIVFDDNGQIEYLIVHNDGKLVTVPWQAAKFNFEQRTALLSLTQEQYKVIPTYTTTQYPAFYTPAYREQIYKSYGLTPAQLRRVERREERRP